MCNSQAAGGQRCHSHTAEALTVAETKYNTLAQAARDTTRAGTPADDHAQLLRARYTLADARARYASTPQGETDLTARMHRLTRNGNPPSWLDPANDDYHAYAEALSEGQRLRARAKDVHDTVLAGQMTGEQAIQLTQYPSDHAIATREAVITGQLTCRTGDLTSHALRGSAQPDPTTEPQTWLEEPGTDPTIE